MTQQLRKLSEMMKEMSERLLRNPDGVPSSEAAHVALFFANVAWNECVGLDHAREGYRNVWETIEAENPELWNEFKSNDIDAMIDHMCKEVDPDSTADENRELMQSYLLGKRRIK